MVILTNTIIYRPGYLFPDEPAYWCRYPIHYLSVYHEYLNTPGYAVLKERLVRVPVMRGPNNKNEFDVAVETALRLDRAVDGRMSFLTNKDTMRIISNQKSLLTKPKLVADHKRAYLDIKRK